MIGTNLRGIADWSTQIPFNDAFKFSRAWFDRNYDPIAGNTDDRGWSISGEVSTAIFINMPGMFPGGRHLVTYQGAGAVDYVAGAKKISTLSPGTDLIFIDPADARGAVLRVRAPIRNIRVIPEGAEGTFNPLFLERVKPFPVLRFMDWMATNNSDQVNLDDRPVPEDARWTTKGVPVEIMVALANELSADPWFCMPHQASDDYIREFAQYVKNNLSSTSRVYIEYSNECWNYKYNQTKWIDEQAKSEGVRSIEWYAKRSAQVITIFKDVLGGFRTIGVLSTQAANIGLGRAAIDYLRKMTYLWPIDRIAIAPYFGHGITGVNLTVDDVFKELDNSLMQSYKWIENYSKLCDEANLPLIAYEGGQHLVADRNNKAIVDLFAAVNRDRRMGDIYRAYIDKWRELGGGLFCHFTDISAPARSGTWGAMEHLGDIESPKYRALIERLKF